MAPSGLEFIWGPLSVEYITKVLSAMAAFCNRFSGLFPRTFSQTAHCESAKITQNAVLFPPLQLPWPTEEQKILKCFAAGDTSVGFTLPGRLFSGNDAIDPQPQNLGHIPVPIDHALD
jgi:hypothetical protein